MPSNKRPAVDEPRHSASTELGPHLLGRVVQPDPRDWSLDRLLTIAEPSSSILDKTISEVMADTTYFTDWSSYLTLWRWLKKQQPPAPSPTPSPTPSPLPSPTVVTDAPAWELDIQLDQGQTNHCVGFGWSGWVDATPVPGSYQNADANAVYYEAKVIDGQPNQENGSSVRSGALAMRNRARLSQFAFAQSTDDIDTWINTNGSVVVGTHWFNDMFNPDSDGWVKPTGQLAGGHCYVMIDRLDSEDAYLFQNSWGSSWGLDGRFKIKISDFAGLLSDDGEACFAIELPH